MVLILSVKTPFLLRLKHPDFQRSNPTVSADVVAPGFVLWTYSDAWSEICLLPDLHIRIIG